MATAHAHAGVARPRPSNRARRPTAPPRRAARSAPVRAARRAPLTAAAASATPPPLPEPLPDRALGTGGQLPSLATRLVGSFGRRTKRLREELAPSLFVLLMGFMCGGVCASALDYLPVGRMGYWSGASGAAFLLVSEFISRQVYGIVPRRRRLRFTRALRRWRREARRAKERGETPAPAPTFDDAGADSQLAPKPWRMLNWLKVGFWLAIFVDAFKVGS